MAAEHSEPCAEIRMVVVGAALARQALACEQDCPQLRFRVAAVLDADPQTVGRRAGGRRIRPLAALPAVVRQTRAEVGVLAVPAAGAQEVADRLVLAGVRGLLNLTTARIVAPRTVTVVDLRITAALLDLYRAMQANPYGRRAAPPPRPLEQPRRRVRRKR